MNIKVVDSIMGSGKTSYMINKMSKETDKNYIYITPFLSEVERVKNNTHGEKFYEPLQKGKGKLDSFKKLIRDGKNIVSTHALFGMADDEFMNLLLARNYVLVLDEVMEVVSTVNLKKSDMNILIKGEYIEVDDDGAITWVGEDYDGRFNDIETMAKHNRLVMGNGNILLWLFPVDVFECFEEVYVLTYMFDGQTMRYYYDMYNLEYEYSSVRMIDGEFKLVEFEDGKKDIVDLIKICNDYKLNKIGEKTKDRENPLSWNWYHDKYKNSEFEYFDIIKKNTTNFFRNKCKAKSKDVLWTIYLGKYIDTIGESEKKDPTEKWRLMAQNSGYQSKRCFASVTARATNDYSNRTCLAYLVNRFMNPVLERFFLKRNVRINKDAYALSEMLQWIFRSAIRNGEEINIYVPSKRMRNLLENWMEN